MLRKCRAAAAVLALLTASLAPAQTLDVPFNTYCPPDSQAACFGVATVTGLDSNGDGFLAVRTGPGTGYPMIGKLPNGGRVKTYGQRGAWHAIGFGTRGSERLG